jgi:dihydroflavonol-4-reductase
VLSGGRNSGRILVTGAGGFLGAAVVRRLLAEGLPVRALVRSLDRAQRLVGLPVELVAADVLDAVAVHRAMAGCTAVLHLAGPSAWDVIGTPHVIDIISRGVQNVLAAARSQGGLRCVYVSSLAALGPSRSPALRDESSPPERVESATMPYVLAKRRAEQHCRDAHDAGQWVAIVRPAEVYGPGDDALISAGNLLHLLRSRPVVVCRGGTSLVHVDDVAAGVVAALDQGCSGEAYFLGGDNLLHHELAAMLLEIAGRPARVWCLPAGLVRQAAAVAIRCRLPFPLPLPLVPYATRYWFVDSQKARLELGLTFRSARETLADTCMWLRSSGRLDA